MPLRSLIPLFLLGAAPVFAQQATPTRGDLSMPIVLAGEPPFEPFALRGGLPGLRHKLEASEPVTIGFLGGSITQNAEHGGFVEFVRDWIAKKYPQARVRTINAGIPATDSAWGAARVGHDLLEERPDAVFVEFAVNDGERDSTADIEKIVRRILASDPDTDIAFLYATSEPAFNKKLSKGKTPTAIQLQERVAGHYGLASLTFGTDLYRQIAAGRRALTDFFKDDCHPKPDGYDSYSRDMGAFLDAVFAAPTTAKQKLPAPLTAEVTTAAPEPVAEPMNEPEPMLDRVLGQATDTWVLPVVGQQWIVRPAFPQNNQEWRISYAVHSEDGADRALTDWQPARWFTEGRGFTGKNSYVLAKPSEKWGTTLSMFPNGGEEGVLLPQISWSAPRPGKYLCKVQAENVSGNTQNGSAAAGLDVFRIRKGSRDSEHIGSASAAPGGGFVLNLSLDLAAGDQLLFRLTSRNFEFCSVESIEVNIGRFEPAGDSLSQHR